MSGPFARKEAELEKAERIKEQERLDRLKREEEQQAAAEAERIEAQKKIFPAASCATALQPI